ncbi:hypothetical protein SPHINGO8BC_51213 [Sphingobacterium multivorum]|uniref:Uncharacterized protein n=1 Tax=Sphingobacterium multivorum TaxID=28454 RepID=A0A654CUN9_SPHMU|nr:hypothetical protein SPHINGO8BC_51213 [Sphingobacterium multivorum]
MRYAKTPVNDGKRDLRDQMFVCPGKPVHEDRGYSNVDQFRPDLVEQILKRGTFVQ